MPFDVQGARAAGYSDAEIADEIAKDAKFDTAGARAAGYTDAEIIAELQPGKGPATGLDRVQAAASGLSSGIASTFGLPVDTALNALDIGKAALGAGYLGADALNRKLGGDGVDIPPFIKLTPRRGVLGSSENIKAGLNSVGIETAPSRPDDKASRYLSTAGALTGGVISGGVYNRLGIPSGITPRPGSPPPAPVPPGAGAPPGGVPPRAAPPPPAPGAPGGPPAVPPIGLNNTAKATLAAGERLGLQVTPGARAGSPQLRQIEARLESLPATSGPFEALKAANGRVVQREFLKAIGESGDEVSSASLASAAERIGKVFDDAAANNKVAYDTQLEGELANIGAIAARELTEAELPQIQRQLNEIVNKAASAGTLEGAAFQNIYSSLGRLTKNGTGGVKDAAASIRDSLHDALVRSAGPDAAKKLTQARDQYRVLLTAEKSGAIDPGGGSIRAGQLGGAFQRADKNGYLRGNRDNGLYDALKFARTREFGPIVGNSGTATRLGGFPDSFYRAAVNAGGNLATRAYLNTPQSVLEGGVRSANATREVVRDMLGIPRDNPAGFFVGLPATAEEELKKGLYK